MSELCLEQFCFSMFFGPRTTGGAGGGTIWTFFFYFPWIWRPKIIRVSQPYPWRDLTGSFTSSTSGKLYITYGRRLEHVEDHHMRCRKRSEAAVQMLLAFLRLVFVCRCVLFFFLGCVCFLHVGYTPFSLRSQVLRLFECSLQLTGQ